ncbi:YetF domain-containing protein [Larkinella soli]|uniref:YetF domain-containing protein n=1 Tax=Larkinella soli TaxID=1770527 RepID=UPI000FFC9996|nr:YetF domain-containing protein [Larkinella soli]
MNEQEPVRAFDWQRILIHDFPWIYLGEVALRTVVMFLIILFALKISAKREVKQLSVFELVLVIGLGSAAGDPMFYHDVPLTSALVVFVVVMTCYKIATRLSDKNKAVREALAGKPVYVIEDGCILVQNFDDEDLGLDELFSELRLAGISQLGQVKTAILEPSGEVSVFRYEPNGVRPGLPIFPRQLDAATETVTEPGRYACAKCGKVTDLEADRATPCRECDHHLWVKAADG